MYSRLLGLLIIVGSAFFLNGCVSDQAFRYYADAKYQAKEPKEVEILWANPKKPFVVIADFQVRGGSAKYMQKKAAQIGADAVIVGMYGGYRAMKDQWAGRDSQSKYYTRLTGTAIRYRRETP